MLDPENVKITDEELLEAISGPSEWRKYKAELYSRANS